MARDLYLTNVAVCLTCLCALAFADSCDASQLGSCFIQKIYTHKRHALNPEQPGQQEDEHTHHQLALDEVGELSLQRSNDSQCEGVIPEDTLTGNFSCPAACPFVDGDEGGSCQFRCVQAQNCGHVNFKANVPDWSKKICRACNVQGCEQCAHGQDRCVKCSFGYHSKPNSDGKCTSDYHRVWFAVYIVILMLVAILLLLWLELRFRPTLNEKGLQEGLAFRDQTKHRQPGTRQLWPLTTNLFRTEVGGPGLTLHFHFQLAIVIWGTLLIIIWVILAASIDSDLFKVGLKSFQSPLEICVAVSWGHKKQTDMMWAKVLFLCIAYVLSFVLCLVHAVFQQRRFQELDFRNKTMGDFTAVLKGLPRIQGSECVERLLKDRLEEHLGMKVVGVSVAWDFEQQRAAVFKALEQDVVLEEEEEAIREQSNSALAQPNPLQERPHRKCCLWSIFKTLDYALCYDGSSSYTDMRKQEVDAASLCSSIWTSDTAFVVFQTEDDRNDAVAKARKTGPISFQDAKLTLEHCHTEPGSVIWENMGCKKYFKRNLALGTAVVLLATIVWAACFYLPYAYYVSSFSYASDGNPSTLSSLVFSLLVVLGNQVIYFVARQVASSVGCTLATHLEAVYLILYIGACTLNSALDVALTGYISYKLMIARSVRTYDGRFLGELGKYLEILESYPMQKVFGDALWRYCRSCFSLPFVIEPIFAIYLPYHFSYHLLRTHPEVRSFDAEKSLAIFTPLDLGRYADCMLNLNLAVMIMFFPTGFLIKTFAFLVAWHVYIIIYDHYRVLRCVPSVSFATDVVDQCANWMMVLPCGAMAAACVFKGQDMLPPQLRPEGISVFWLCVGAFSLHTLLHALLLAYVVPYFEHVSHREDDTSSYEKVSEQLPASWFSVNPVNCLRSKHIYKEAPFCVYLCPGKAHLLRKNAQLGIYYEEPLPAKTTS